MRTDHPRHYWYRPLLAARVQFSDKRGPLHRAPIFFRVAKEDRSPSSFVSKNSMGKRAVTDGKKSYHSRKSEEKGVERNC